MQGTLHALTQPDLNISKVAGDCLLITSLLLWERRVALALGLQMPSEVEPPGFRRKDLKKEEMDIQ